MLKRTFLGALGVVTLMMPGHAILAQTGISQKVGVCDPSYPGRCIKPAADGSIAITGGGGSSGGTATVAAPTYVEGATSQPISLNLKGAQRVIPTDTDGDNMTDQTNNALRVNVVTGAAAGVAQGSTTSGQLGNLTQAAVTTAAPSYTTAQTSPLSLDPHGSLRGLILDSTGVAVDWTAAVPVTQSGTWTMQPGNTANTTAWKVDGSAVTQPVSIALAAAITPIVSAAAEGSHILKASAGSAYRVSTTTGASAGYVMVFNATSAPADGAVTPIVCRVIAANTSVELDWSTVPKAFATGITVVFSTTGCFTKTVSATAFFEGDIR